MAINYVNGNGVQRVMNLSESQERYHTLMAGETIFWLAQQYHSKGVSVGQIHDLNRDRAIFRAGHQGDFEYLLPEAQVLMGVW